MQHNHRTKVPPSCVSAMKWVRLLSKCPDHRCLAQGNRPLQYAEEKRMRLASARNWNNDDHSHWHQEATITRNKQREKQTGESWRNGSFIEIKWQCQKKSEGSDSPAVTVSHGLIQLNTDHVPTGAAWPRDRTCKKAEQRWRAGTEQMSWATEWWDIPTNLTVPLCFQLIFGLASLPLGFWE